MGVGPGIQVEEDPSDIHTPSHHHFHSPGGSPSFSCYVCSLPQVLWSQDSSGETLIPMVMVSMMPVTTTMIMMVSSMWKMTKTTMEMVSAMMMMRMTMVTVSSTEMKMTTPMV